MGEQTESSAARARGARDIARNLQLRRAMQTPVHITFRNLEHSAALAAHVQQRGEKLDLMFDRIVSCHVVITLAGHHREHGDRYDVSIIVGLPEHEVIVKHASEKRRAAESPFQSADRAFDAAEHQIDNWLNRRREENRRESLAS